MRRSIIAPEIVTILLDWQVPELIREMTSKPDAGMVRLKVARTRNPVRTHRSVGFPTQAQREATKRKSVDLQ
jgi:hypothetical protein